MKSKLMYIIPAHKVDHRLKYAVESALAQTEQVRVVVVGPDAVINGGIPDKIKSSIDYLAVDDGDTSTQALINAGIEYAQSQDDVEWVSFLEFDDKLLPRATSLFMEYRDANEEATTFAGLALVVEPNGDRDAEQEAQTPNLKTMANEAAWAANIMDNVGIFDFNAMLRMNFLVMTAMYFKLEIFEEIGVLKPNMKYFYDFEFLLRVVYNGHEPIAIPKATHYHFTGGEQIEAHHTLNKDEADFWSSAARKEYFFEFDRELAYEPTEEIETAET
jgi:hypothetical protein